MPTLFLDGHAAKALIRMADVINVVKEVFGMCGEGRGRMPTKTYLYLEHADFRAMPAALPGCGGGKITNVRSENAFHGSHWMRKAVANL